MKTQDVISQLENLKEHCEDFADGTEDCPFTQDVRAIDEAIDRLTTPTDRYVANEILLWAGLIFGCVGMIATMCGVLYIILGACDRAWALLPWALVSGASALLAFGGVRK